MISLLYLLILILIESNFIINDDTFDKNNTILLLRNDTNFIKIIGILIDDPLYKYEVKKSKKKLTNF
jgi:hypothetical protein